MISIQSTALTHLYKTNSMSDTDTPQTSIQSTANGTTEVLVMQPNTYCMLLHLSQLLGLTAIPGFGLAVPIVLWAIGKDKSAQVDLHGRIILNWIISCLIYLVAACLLCLTIIGAVVGIPALLTLWILGIVFPIIGAIKANDGVAWKYPLCISFFK